MNETAAAPRAGNDIGGDESGFFNSSAGSGICRPLVRILDQNKSVSRRFFELINRLNKFFSISRAVLIINDKDGDSLKMMTAWEQARLREGVMLTIPRENSLLRRASGIRVIINRSATGEFPPEYQGNFIENNILFDKSTSSLAICPLFAGKTLMGITCLTSSAPFAFELIEEGYFDGIFRQLGEVLADEYMLSL